MRHWGNRLAVVFGAALLAGCSDVTVKEAQLHTADASLLAGGTTYQYDHFRMTVPAGWQARAGSEVAGGTTYSGLAASLIVITHEWRTDRQFSFWLNEHEAALRRDPEWRLQKEFKIALGERAGRLYEVSYRRTGAQIAVVEVAPGRAVEMRFSATRGVMDDSLLTVFHAILQTLEFEGMPAGR